jgi:hypothetical protein
LHHFSSFQVIETVVSPALVPLTVLAATTKVSSGSSSVLRLVKSSLTLPFAATIKESIKSPLVTVVPDLSTIEIELNSSMN